LNYQLNVFTTLGSFLIIGLVSSMFCYMFYRPMSSLRTLNLSHNQLREIPASLGRVGSLKHLNLSNNYITVVPEEIGLAQILESLDLR